MRYLVKPSPHCSVCQYAGVAKLNVLILKGTPIPKIAKATGLSISSLRNHQRKHLPYRHPDKGKPATLAEALADLQLELQRLQVLGESGLSVGGAIAAVNAQRGLLELQARLEGRLEGGHKTKLAAPEVGDELEINFSGGRATAKVVEQ